MTSSSRAIGAWLARRAENIAAAMLAAMFAAFLLQIAFRYLLGLPIGWTHEISVVLWLWLVLWGAAFVVSEREEIRFDIIYGAVGPGPRRVMALISAVALISLVSRVAHEISSALHRKVNTTFLSGAGENGHAVAFEFVPFIG